MPAITLKQEHKQHKKLKEQEQENIKRVLQSIKEETQEHLDPETISDIKSAIMLKESTTYELILLDQQEYIAHQFTKLKAATFKSEAVFGIDLFTQKFLLNYQLNDSKAPAIVIKNLSTQNVNNLNNELKQKLSKINSNLNALKHMNKKEISAFSHFLTKNQQQPYKTQPSSKISPLLGKRATEHLKSFLQFKQPQYWLKNEEKTKKIKEFLDQHQRQYQIRHRKYQQSLEKSRKRIEEQNQIKLSSKLEARNNIFRSGLQKSLNYKQKRQSSLQYHQNQLDKIEEFLEKLNTSNSQQNKRLYELLQQRYSKQQQQEKEQYEQKLSKIKVNHSPLDPEEFQEHLQKHQEYKESLKEQNQAKREEFMLQVQEANQQLRGLFHSKRYDKIAYQSAISPYKRSFSEMVNRKTKKKQFSLGVKEKFKPQISQKKKQQLEESIRLLQMSQNKTKRKVLKNGSYEFEEKEEADCRKIGLENLAFLKQYLQQKKKKQERPISTSLIQPVSIKKIDYLREQKPQIKFKISMAEWKKVMDDKNFKSKDKFSFLKQSISTLQHKAIEKEVEARNLKKSPLQLEKKDQFDRYFMESIQAKMAILNDLLLGPKK